MVQYVRYDHETATHSTLTLEPDGWRLVVRRASEPVSSRVVPPVIAIACIEQYGYTQVEG